MKSWITRILCAMLCAAVLTGCAASGAQSEEPSDPIEIEAQTWQIVCASDPNSSAAKAVKKFAQLITESTNGAIQVECHTSNELANGSSTDAIHGVMDGAITLSLHSNLDYEDLDPRFGVVSLPFLFDSEEAADTALNGEGGEALRSVLDEYGLQCLGIGENGFRLPTNSLRAVASVSDFSGLRLWTADSGVVQNAYRAWGAQIDGTSWPMVFTALQTGTLDGQENPPTVADAASIQQTQTQVTKWTGIYECLFLCMNKEQFDSLTPEVQKIVEECGSKATVYQRQTNRDSQEKILSQWAGKMTVTELTEDAAKEFRQAAQPCYDAFSETVSPELLETFQN